MNPRSRYMAHSSLLTHDRRSSRARCSARRSLPGSCASRPVRLPFWLKSRRQRRVAVAAERAISGRLRTVAKSASARRARSICGDCSRTSAAGRTREEDHALCLAWNLRVVLHHERLATTRRRIFRRHCGPHSLVELARELLHEELFLLADLGVTLGEQNLAKPGLHAEQLQGGTDLMTARSPPKEHPRGGAPDRCRAARENPRQRQLFPPAEPPPAARRRGRARRP